MGTDGMAEEEYNFNSEVSLELQVHLQLFRLVLYVPFCVRISDDCMFYIVMYVYKYKKA